MASGQSLVGLLGVALLCARGAALLGEGRRRAWLAGGAFALAWIPVGDITLAGYVRGVTGDLSITTIVVLLVSLAGRAERTERSTVSFAVVAGALVLYPMSLGLGGFDPYRLGYVPGGAWVILFVAAVALWLRRHDVALACIVLAVAAHALELMESTNLWDYLVDPWITVASIYDLRRVRRKT